MLFLTADTKVGGSWTMFNAIAQLFFIFAVFAIILFAAYYVTKKMSAAKFSVRSNSSLKILDSMAFGIQSGIHLVKAGKKYVLLGITKDRITFLCELTEEDLDGVKEDGKAPSFSFETYLNRIMKRDS